MSFWGSGALAHLCAPPFINPFQTQFNRRKMMTVLRFDDNRGGLAYPFLPNDLQWQIVSRPFSDEESLAKIFQADPPTLRWVKDDKVLDLTVPNMDTQTFLERTGLKLSMHKGGYVLSKRLSRVMRPFRYWRFFDEAEVTIDYNELLDGKLWDGSGQVSRGFIQRLADSLDPSTAWTLRQPGPFDRLRAGSR
jgi:hypothetical protein